MIRSDGTTPVLKMMAMTMVDGKNPHSFGQRAGKQEQAGGEEAQSMPKTPLDKLVGGIKFAGKIAGDEEETHHHARHQVSQDKLQKAQVRAIGNTRRADDRKDAGFGADNRQRDRPPGQAVSPQKVIAQSPLALRKRAPKAVMAIT